ncbi:hypothetical protein V7796_20570 [Rhizobium laguerreae]
MSRDRGVLAGLGDERVAYASRDDMAAALAGALVSDGHSGAIYNLTGPDTVTGQQRAAIASDVLRSPFSFAAIEEDQLRAAMSLAGLPDLVVAAIVEIKKTFIAGYFDLVTGDIERLSGRKPRSFRGVLAATPA